MLCSFYYYSLARPDHLRADAYRLKRIISAAISSLTRKALLYYCMESTSPAPAASYSRGWVLCNTSRSSGNGILSRMARTTIDP